jgi:hypothetical protein
MHRQQNIKTCLIIHRCTVTSICIFQDTVRCYTVSILVSGVHAYFPPLVDILFLWLDSSNGSRLRDQSQTHHTRQDSSGQVIGPWQRHAIFTRQT